MKPRVLITGTLHPVALEILKKSGKVDVVNVPECAHAEIVKKIVDFQVLVTRSETKVDKAIIDAGTHLKVIARAAVGVSNIDIEYATKKGILVINTPGKNTNSAAELTLALLLSIFRKVPEAQVHVKAGQWERHRFNGLELRGKHIGIVGLGNVGHRVARFAHGFNMEVSAYDPYIAPAIFEKHDVRSVKSLAELAAQVDILTVHVPLNSETKGMVTREILSMLKKGAYVINAARGGLFKETDILAALQSGQLAGVGIDTFENEPCDNGELLRHPLVYCTPHIGANTEEAQIAIGTTVSEQVLKAIDGGVVDYPVNLPEIGIIDNPMIRVYSVLAEKLGSLMGQLLSFNPSEVELTYRGALSEMDPSLIRLAWMKGYMGHIVTDFVSFVNAATLFEKQGVQLREKKDPGFTSYRSAIKITMKGPNGASLVVGGFVFDDRYLRLSLINDFYLEVEPSGNMIIIENNDRPGVVGHVGQFLADRQVNIDTFALARNKQGGRAMAVIRVDSEAATIDTASMRKIPNIVDVKAVRV